MSDKQLAWDAYRAAWNEADSMDSMTKLEERTARRSFESWWQRNHGESDDTLEMGY